MTLFDFPHSVALAAIPTEVEGRGLFVLSDALTVQAAGQTFVVPRGFETDGASVPWWARGFIPLWGRCGLPSVLHDYLITQSPLPKWACDWLFLGALKAQGVSDLRAVLMYLAVRTKPRQSVAH